MEQNQNWSGQQNPFPSAPAKNSSAVFLVGGIILIVILAFLGWYFLKEQGETIPIEQSLNGETDAATTALVQQGTSDELSDIETDLEATDLDSLNEIDQL
ncbi:MAG: hypothetical protein A2942_00110 [Candidatus Lloydbacteria bacterium RIFCSPLOWO2_01_FULL_50_20]|uniref:Uncharacterized protein n=1 Tax=Candidatus Lloydbacteria bacterium RIFCSPLOWO2_01_FULL_50_20 TaxID=1798665 RepID=A0A1G2DJE1_9BACT|nr:MAG: hypothetical protein A3C13_00615 [Candidatus Lloydbacteria bacterium RIFCSPHIGHO2_02_FULL_50_11]OGZ13775.1 MAG: hypothetical protein A2942_00110 [Candidatus Lloydbacteria bacterium RIFCSPLOWO2_01_FULL_50_20]